MENLKLQFISPRFLDELQQADTLENPVWHEAETGSELTLDTKQWIIRSETKEGKIDRWKVDQNQNQMILASSEISFEGYETLDYVFAVSMIGQIGNKQLLQDYLKSLQDVYFVQSEGNGNSPEQEQKEQPQKEVSKEPSQRNEIPSNSTQNDTTD